jgi:hypothetical protein
VIHSQFALFRAAGSTLRAHLPWRLGAHPARVDHGLCTDSGSNIDAATARAPPSRRQDDQTRRGQCHSPAPATAGADKIADGAAVSTGKRGTPPASAARNSGAVALSPTPTPRKAARPVAAGSPTALVKTPMGHLRRPPSLVAKMLLQRHLCCLPASAASEPQSATRQRRPRQSRSLGPVSWPAARPWPIPEPHFSHGTGQLGCQSCSA